MLRESAFTRCIAWYKKRRFYGFRKEVSKEFHKDGTSTTRSPIGTLYLAELEEYLLFICG
jgi:hypothetical protein